MYLLFDLSIKDTIHLAVFDKKSIEHKNYSGRNRELLSCVDDFLMVNHLPCVPLLVKEGGSKPLPLTRGGAPIRIGAERWSIGGIMVVTGAGGFTSTRVACVVANTFAYVLQIPLLAITLAEASDPQKLIPKLLKQKPGNYISATYSGDANIGRKKVKI